MKVKDCTSLQWIANGKVIARKAITAKNGETAYVLDLDKIGGAEDFLYVRCELFGKGGCTLTQALVIDNGSAAELYTVDSSARARFAAFIDRLRALRIFVLLRVLMDKIAN